MSEYKEVRPLITLYIDDEGMVYHRVGHTFYTDRHIVMDEDALLAWVEDHKTSHNIIGDLLQAIKDGEFDEISGQWAAIAPRIEAALRDIKYNPVSNGVKHETYTDNEWREMKWTNRDIERICEWIAETGDPAKLYGKKLRAKIVRGLEEGRW